MYQQVPAIPFLMELDPTHQIHKCTCSPYAEHGFSAKDKEFCTKQCEWEIDAQGLPEWPVYEEAKGG